MKKANSKDEELARRLTDLPRDQQLTLLTELFATAPEVAEWVEADLTALTASVKSKPKAPKRKQADVQVYRQQVRGIMHSLDHLRASEAYWMVGGLTDELREVQQEALEYLSKGDAESAIQILIAIVAESYDAFDYIDGSNGELGSFLDGIGDTLAEAILSLDWDDEQLEDLLSDLDEFHVHLSNYGVDGLDVAVAAAQYGWGDLPQERPARQTDSAEDDDDQEGGDGDESYLHPGAPENLARRLTRAKLNVLERDDDIDSYLALCLQTGEHLRYALKLCDVKRAPEALAYALKNFSSADEILKLAQRLRESRRLDDALRIAEHGLKLDGSKASLGEWLGPIEEAQGRTKQALEAWLIALRDVPSLEIYQTVKRLAGSRWSKLKPEVMEALEKGWDREEHVKVLIFEQQWDEAIKIADRRDSYHGVVRIVADAIISHRPEWVIRASVKQANDLIAKTKSKHYSAAVDWLKKAKAAYAQLGKTAEWQKFLQQLREEYRRRPALQAQLNKL